MSNVLAFQRRAHVVIESGRITGGDSATLIDCWCHMVDFVDEDGLVLHDYIGTDREKAREAAASWALDHGCAVLDRSESDPST